MKSNPTRAGPSLFGNLHSNLSKGNEAGRGHAEESEGPYPLYFEFRICPTYFGAEPKPMNSK